MILAVCSTHISSSSFAYLNWVVVIFISSTRPMLHATPPPPPSTHPRYLSPSASHLVVSPYTIVLAVDSPSPFTVRRPAIRHQSVVTHSDARARQPNVATLSHSFPRSRVPSAYSQSHPQPRSKLVADGIFYPTSPPSPPNAHSQHLSPDFPLHVKFSLGEFTITTTTVPLISHHPHTFHHHAFDLRAVLEMISLHVHSLVYLGFSLWLHTYVNDETPR